MGNSRQEPAAGKVGNAGEADGCESAAGTTLEADENTAAKKKKRKKHSGVEADGCESGAGTAPEADGDHAGGDVKNTATKKQKTKKKKEADVVDDRLGDSL